MRSTATTTTIVAAVLLRACVSLHGYSGEGVPPMYGDFEAQRHWMEVTVNLPAERWYVHGPDNDLQYWGLDYPPLSAHFSWAVGRLAQAWHPQLVALHASRGHESAETRAFMRRSVLVADLLVFVPAALAFARLPAAAGGGGGAPIRTLALLLLSPPLVLVDHGHFQYNCVSLGLALWALVAALSGRPLACCVAFSLSLNFKQMGLYLAPAVFCYLLAGVLRTRGVGLAASRFCALGAVTSLTFAACWAPFLASATPYDSTLAVLRRVFPTSRSLYEDKVANVWCTMALLPPLKLKAKLALENLLRLSLGCTLAALLPPCALLLRAPSRRAFLLCATACGLAFFLLSFQVHEKHLLLPLLPAALLSTEHPRAYAWFALLAAFSMFPLLARDGLRLAYSVCQLAFGALAAALTPPMEVGGSATAGGLLLAASLAGMVALHVAEAALPPPRRYPDLHAVAFSAYACCHLVGAYAACLHALWRTTATAPPHTPLDGGGTTVRERQKAE